MKKQLKLDLNHSITRLKITTSKLVNTGFIGTYKSLFKGRGLEFAGYRQYTPDDDASQIDWKASVKSKSLLVKQYVEERNLSLFFLIDVSSSMIYGANEKLKVEYAAEIAATLSYVVLNAGDNVGFGLFTDEVTLNYPPVNGYKQYHTILKTLVNPNFYGGNYDLGEALKFPIASLKDLSVVIVISDFVGLKEGWNRYLRILTKKCDVIGIMVRDERDKTLPDFDGRVILQDPYSNKKLMFRPSDIREAYSKYVEKQEENIKQEFLSANADFLSLSTDKDFAKPITSFFIKRSKLVH